MTDITLSRVTDWADLGKRWRALEGRSKCSFFQSWTWTGCLAEERFDDTVLLEATSDGRVVVMALFNRHRVVTGQQTLWLGETGRREFDAIYIEWNGLLAEAGTPPSLLADCLRAARLAPLNGGWRHWVGRRLVLSGVDEPTIEAAHAAGGSLWVRRQSAAPYVDLAALLQMQQTYLAALSSNTRYRLRRSERAYAATGKLELRRATSLDEAVAFLDALEVLHQVTWTRRGRTGAFADAWIRKFHRTLVQRGLERGEIALLRLTAGERVVGYLYNFEFRGSVVNYQSGFDYEGAQRHQTPGLTSHHQAIVDAASRGLARYDFLAGDDRYKRSLGTAEAKLGWLELGGGWPGRLLARWAR